MNPEFRIHKILISLQLSVAGQLFPHRIKCISHNFIAIRLQSSIFNPELIVRIGNVMDFFSQRLEINRFGKKHFGAGINGFLIIFFVTVS